MIRGMLWWLAACAVFGVGCGGTGPNGERPTAGRVTFDGKPGDGILVTFVPIGQTGGVGGAAVTAADGSFEIVGHDSSAGLRPGEYAITASRRRNPDGSLPDPNVPPIESFAVETLEAAFADRERTPLRAKLPSEAPLEFAVRPAKK